MRGVLRGLVVLVCAAAPWAAAEETLGVQVNRAVDRAVARLKKAQNADGSFQGEHAHHYPTGVTALALYALAKSQVTEADPATKAAVAYVKARPLQKTYEVAAAILGLDALKDPAHDEWIRTAGKWLEDNVHAKEGAWAYPFGPNADYTKTDISNTQFAVLGLWTAERHGYQASKDLWVRLATATPDYQLPFGAFFYSTNRGQRYGTGSMTTAGITVLTLALERIPAGDREKPYAERAAKSLKKAWEYLERRLTLDTDVEGDYAFTEGGHLYYLYGLERVAALAGRREIAGRDWYREGAARLVAIQEKDGLWNATTEQTCFALLFLRKATATGLGQSAPDALAGPGATTAPPPAGPTKPGDAVPFVTRWLVLGPYPNADDSGLSTDAIGERAVAPSAGTRVGKLAWTAHASTANFVSLVEATRAGHHSLSYAFTYLHVDKETDVVLWFDHDDGAKLILDGRVIHDRHVHEGAVVDRRHVPVRLTAGLHRLLWKVEEWTGGHSGFFLRIAHADGTDAPEVLASPSSDPPSGLDRIRARPERFSLQDLFRLMPTDTRTTLSFSRREDLDRVVVSDAWPGYPAWFAAPEARPHQPHPGAKGFVAIHPRGAQQPALLVRKVRLPPGLPFLRLSVSADPYESGPEADFVLRVSVFDGALRSLSETVVAAGAPSPDGWRTVDTDLRASAGKDVLLLVEWAAGGKVPWLNEEGFLDDMSVGLAAK